jgi:dolichol kinase
MVATKISATRQTVSWSRKLFHASTISAAALVIAFSGLPRPYVLDLVCAFAFLVGGLDLLRLALPSWNERVLRDFARILRKHEENTVSSGFWFLAGALATLSIASLPITGLALLYLALGDPLASWIGVRFGRTRLPGGKSLEGSLAFALLCTVLGTFFLGATATVGWAQAALVALGGALAAAAAEWVPVPVVDDNFRVPVAAAAALTALTSAFTPVVVV